MIFLNANDINKTISYSQLIEAIEEAFLIQEEQNFIMPQRMHIEQNENTLLLMPAFIEDYFATKLVSIFPENKKHNQAIIQGKLVLNDTKTGEVLAIIDAPKLTAIRTAAVGAVAIKYLHQDKLDKLGLIGAGVQGLHQIILAYQVHQFKQVYIYDPFLNKIQQEAFIENLGNKIRGVEYHFTDRADEVLIQSDLIITATSSEDVVLPNNSELVKGKTFIAIGSFKPNMRELPEHVFSFIDHLYIDTPSALKESGDLILPLKNGWLKKDQIHNLGKIINGEIVQSKSKTVVFKSVGMALFDLVVAKHIYELALRQNLGTKIQD